MYPPRQRLLAAPFRGPGARASNLRCVNERVAPIVPRCKKALVPSRSPLSLLDPVILGPELETGYGISLRRRSGGNP